MKRVICSVIFLIFVQLFSANDIIAQTVIRVNCGGDAFRDHLGNYWSRDQAYSPGGWGYELGGYALVYPYEINGTVDDPLYQAERNALQFYRFTVPNGKYYVTLKFAELYYKKVGDRIFHVNIEGNRVISNFDMVATAGFATAIDRTIPVEVRDGVLDIFFITIEVAPGITIAHANIKAIEVIEQGTHEPNLWVNKKSLNFGRNSSIQVFEIRNGGELPLEWSAFENPDETWIKSVEPVDGILYQGQASEVRVEVSRNGLTEGFYQGKITIDSNGGLQDIDVSMEVKNDYPILDISRSALDYGSILTSRKILIRNTGTARLNWNAYNGNNASWITSINPQNGGINPGGSQELIIQIDRSRSTDSTLTSHVSLNTNVGNRNIEIHADKGIAPLRINCGGGDYIDQDDNIWYEDMHYLGGEPVNDQNEVTNTENEPLYQDSRNGMFSYSIPMQENGLYRLALHFVESQYEEVGERIFNAIVEDTTLISNFDILAEAPPRTAVIKETTVTAADSTLDLQLDPLMNDATISALELRKIPDAPNLLLNRMDLNFGNEETRLYFSLSNFGAENLEWTIHKSPDCTWIRRVLPDSGVTAYSETDSILVIVDRRNLPNGIFQDTLNVLSNGGNGMIQVAMQVGSVERIVKRINAGGEAYVDTAGNHWEADQEYVRGEWGYIGGDKFVNQVGIDETRDDPLYQSERWGMDSYCFDVPNGKYDIILHFAEIYFLEAQRRVMDVLLEGELVLDDFDIFAEVGSRKPCLKQANVEVKDNYLDIQFVRGIDDPKISAIEIIGTVTINPLPTRRVENALIMNEGSHVIIPEEFMLDQNYPNPFNMETTISFSLPYNADVKLEIFNLLGQCVKIVQESYYRAGYHHVSWNGTDAFGNIVPSGFYVYSIHINPIDDESRRPFRAFKKMLLLK